MAKNRILNIHAEYPQKPRPERAEENLSDLYLKNQKSMKKQLHLVILHFLTLLLLSLTACHKGESTTASSTTITPQSSQTPEVSITEYESTTHIPKKTSKDDIFSHNDNLTISDSVFHFQPYMLKTDWMERYIHYLKTHLNEIDGQYGASEYTQWRLGYVNNDTIPELFLSGGCWAAGTRILSQHNGKIYTYCAGSFRHILGSNGLILCVIGKTDFYATICKMDKGKFKELCRIQTEQEHNYNYAILNKDTLYYLSNDDIYDAHNNFLFDTTILVTLPNDTTFYNIQHTDQRYKAKLHATKNNKSGVASNPYTAPIIHKEIDITRNDWQQFSLPQEAKLDTLLSLKTDHALIDQARDSLWHVLKRTYYDHGTSVWSGSGDIYRPLSQLL